MSDPQLIPTQPGLQIFSVTLANVPYNVRIMWNEVANPPFYAIDIATMNGAAFADGSTLLAGLPLLTGVDVLGQFAYLGIGGKLLVLTDRDTGEDSTYDGLGTTSRLYFIPDA